MQDLLINEKEVIVMKKLVIAAFVLAAGVAVYTMAWASICPSTPNCIC